VQHISDLLRSYHHTQIYLRKERLHTAHYYKPSDKSTIQYLQMPSLIKTRNCIRE